MGIQKSFFAVNSEVCTPEYIDSHPTPSVIKNLIVSGAGGIITAINDVNPSVWKSCCNYDGQWFWGKLLLVSFNGDRSLGNVNMVSRDAYDDNGYVQYQFRYKKNGDTNWKKVINTPYNYVDDLQIPDFESGVDYLFSVQAYDFNGNSSSEATRLINSSNIDTQPPTWDIDGMNESNVNHTPLKLHTSPNTNDLASPLVVVAGESSGFLIFEYKSTDVDNDQSWQKHIYEGSASGISFVEANNSYNYGNQVSEGVYIGRVFVMDKAGNILAALDLSTPLEVKNKSGDITGPVWGIPYIISPIKNGSQYQLKWTAAGDNIGVDHYNVTILNNSTVVKLLDNVKFSSNISDLITFSSAVSYTVTIDAYDKANNINKKSITMTFPVGHSWP